jgi:hypothetical protein
VSLDPYLVFSNCGCGTVTAYWCARHVVSDDLCRRTNTGAKPLALTSCPECGTSVSTSANACPNCGAPIADEIIARAKNAGKGWEPCPRCGSNRVEKRGASFLFGAGLGTVVVTFAGACCLPFVLIIGLPVGIFMMLMSPFFYGRLECQVCKYEWRYPSRMTFATANSAPGKPATEPASPSANVSQVKTRGRGYVLALIFGSVCIGLVCIGLLVNVHRPDSVQQSAARHYEGLRNILEIDAKSLIDQYPKHMEISEKAVDRKFEYVKESTTEKQFTDRSLQLQKMYANRFAHSHRDKTDSDVTELKKNLDDLNKRLAQAFAELVRSGQIEVETDEPKVTDDIPH